MSADPMFRFLGMSDLKTEDVEDAFKGFDHPQKMIRISCSKLLGRSANQNTERMKLLLPRLVQGLADGSPLVRGESARALSQIEGPFRIYLAVAIWCARKSELDGTARDSLTRGVLCLTDASIEGFSAMMSRLMGQKRTEGDSPESEETVMAVELIREGRGIESDLATSVLAELLAEIATCFLQKRGIL